MPSRRSSKRWVRTIPVGAGARRRIHSEYRMARNETAFTAKHQPGPTAAYTNSARGGPMTRLALKMVELSATALLRYSCGTSEGSLDYRQGVSTAVKVTFAS